MFIRGKIEVLLNFFQKIAVSKGRAFGRTPQSAKTRVELVQLSSSGAFLKV